MRVTIHKTLWGKLRRAKKVTTLEQERLEKYKTKDFLRMTFRLAHLTIVSFWRRHKVLSRLVLLLLILAILASVVRDIYSGQQQFNQEKISDYNGIIGDPINYYSGFLKKDSESQSVTFNEGYQPGGERAGDSAQPTYTAHFASKSGNSAVTVKDAANSVEVSFEPEFAVAPPTIENNRVSYKVLGRSALKVYSLLGSGVKEDIVLTRKPKKDEMTFRYKVHLSDGLEMRSENDGSLGVYGVSSVLLGNVTAATESDQKLIDAARQNGEKSKLLFAIPAPYVIGPDKKASSATAWYEYKDGILSVHSRGLESAQYPLSIDPSVYVETARKLMRGNNETNVDFDATNELIQKSQTTGARIDGWADTTDMSAGVWNHSVAMAGGYVYRAGGRVDPTVPYIMSQTSTQVNSTNASTNFVMNMPTDRPSGDLYVAVISRDGSGTITPPSGWLLYSTGTNTTTTTRDVAMYYRVGGAGEPATYTWTNSASVQWTGTILRIRGFNSGSPISAAPAATTGTATTTTAAQFPAITPSHDATLIIRAIGINESDPSEYTWLPSGHTKLHSSTSQSDVASSTALVVTSLDVPPIATNAAAAANLNLDGIMLGDYGAISVAIRPATVTAGYQNTVEWARIDDSNFTITSPNPGTGTCSDWCNNSAYNLPANRVGMTMVAYNGYLYALGGTSDGTIGNTASTVWIAKLGANGEPQLWHPTDTDTDNWVYWYSSSNTLPAAVFNTSAVAYKNRLYLAGGRNSSGNSVNTVHVAEFRPNGDIGAWSTTGMQTLPEANGRQSHSIHIYNDVMYVLGGITTTAAGATNTFLNTVYYSKLTSSGTMGAWTNTNQNFTTARGSLGGQMTAIWGGYIYLAGGCSAVTVSGSNQYCNTVASDVQLASINADGTIAPWNSIATLSNQRFSQSFFSWQGGLYRLGGCNRQNTSTGVCYATHRNVEYGDINPPGDASTVSNSEPSGTSPCSGGSPVNCDLPPVGDGAGQGGQMSSSVVVNNGFIYVIGGCTTLDNSPTTDPDCVNGMSGNVSYAALNSTGQMVAPANCPSPNTSYGLWCVDSTNQVNGTAGVGTASAAVFNNRIYVVGGTNGNNWHANVWSVLLNADGSLASTWNTQSFTNLDLGTARGYSFVFTRANPTSTTYPGNLFVLGGCNGGTGGDGLGCNTYFEQVYKCNILTTGLLEEADANDCTTTGQLQIDADLTNDDGLGDDEEGLGLMSGTVYANRVYLIGGACPSVGTVGPCRSAVSGNREDTMFARIDSSNNIVDNDTGLVTGQDWNFASAKMSPVRRRAVGFGYNGYIYSLAGYSGTSSLQDLLFAKINVSTGDLSAFSRSGVVVTPRWDLRAVVSNGYVYAIGGCGTGDAPTECSDMQEEIQTFQLYNNDSGTPISFAASASQLATDRFGASSTVKDGVLYVAGGCISSSVESCATVTTSVEYSVIDTYGNLGSWTAGGALPAGRAWGQLEVLGTTTKSLYYIGGQNGGGTAQTTVYYTSSFTGNSPNWSTSAQPLPLARTQFGASSWDNRIYVVGGSGSGGTCTGGVCDMVYVSSQQNSGGDLSGWTLQTTTFNVDRSGAAVLAYANNLYLMGGFDGTNYLSDVQVASLGYKTGSISQSGTTTVTGSGTSWTSAMIGRTLQYNDGTLATIQTVPSATSLTVNITKTGVSGEPYVIQDGSVGTWSYTTGLPEPIRQADTFAANGYVYLVGGRSASGDCTPNVLQAPISANTVVKNATTAYGINNPTGVGEWYETNVKYTGDRFGNAVSYYQGKMYVMGGACQSTPYVHSILSQTFATEDNNHLVTMPSTVDAGDLLIVLMSSDNATAVTDPDGAGGWTLIAEANDGGSNVRGTIYAKDAVGTEDGLTVDFATGVTNQKAATQLYRIPAAKWEGNIASVVASTAVTATTQNPNPGSLNPAGWASPENTLWLSFVAGSRYASVTNYPANHTNGQMTVSFTDDTGASVSSSRIETNADSEDPGTYTMDASKPSVSYTIAVRPAAFAYTGSNSVVQAAVYSQPQVASYSRLIDTDTSVFPNSWLVNGLDSSIGAKWRAEYRSSADTPNIAFHESFDDGTNGATVNGTLNGSTNSDYSFCYNTDITGTASHTFSNAWSVTPSLSQLFSTTGGTANTACDILFEDTSTSSTRYDRFYINFSSAPVTDTVIYQVYDNNSADTVAQLRVRSAANGTTLQLRDRFTAEDTITLGTGTHRIEVGIVNDQMTVRVYSGANLHTETISDSDVIDLDLGPNTYDEFNFGIATQVDTWSIAFDDHKASKSDWVGSAFPSWGTTTTQSEVTLGDVMDYTPYNSAGVDTNYARWYFMNLSIDTSQTFGYPEDVDRGPTIWDLSLFFTADPNKRLRHGKTFTGGEQQPLDTPCRQSVDAQCPLP